MALALAANKAREIPPLPFPDTSQANSMAAIELQLNAEILELADAILPAALDNTTTSVIKSTKGGGKAKMWPGPTKNRRYVPHSVH